MSFRSITKLSGNPVYLDGSWQSAYIALLFALHRGHVMALSFNTSREWNTHICDASLAIDAIPNSEWRIHQYRDEMNQMVTDIRRMTKLLGRTPTFHDAINCTPFLYLERMAVASDSLAVVCQREVPESAIDMMNKSEINLIRVSVPESASSIMEDMGVPLVGSRLDEMVSVLAQGHLSLQGTRYAKGSPRQGDPFEYIYSNMA